MRCVTACFLVLAAGCAAPADDEDSSAADLTNGDTGDGPSYIVQTNQEIVEADGTKQTVLCTANVISAHYLLTAAHCFRKSGEFTVDIRGGATGGTAIYNGKAAVEIHPAWVDGATDREKWDVALIRLKNGDASSAGRIRVYAGGETPWASHGGYYWVWGYGVGTNTGGAQDCPTDPNSHAGVKRGGRFAFEGNNTSMKEGSSYESIHGYSTIRSLCPGDSGAAYQLNRNNENFLFGLQQGSDLSAGGQVWGPLVAPKMDWILEQTTGATMDLPLACNLVRDHRSSPEVEYYDCQEHPKSPVVIGHPIIVAP